MASGFEPVTPATKRPQTYVLDRAATGIGIVSYFTHPLSVSLFAFKMLGVMFSCLLALYVKGLDLAENIKITYRVKK
jgi:hypothetical protein